MHINHTQKIWVLVIGGFLLSGCSKAADTEIVRSQLTLVLQERDHLLVTQKQNQEKLEAAAATQSQLQTELKQCQTLVITPTADTRERKGFVKPASVCSHNNDKDVPAGPEELSSALQKVIASEQALEQSYVQLETTQKSLEQAAKATAKQQRAFRKEEKRLLQLSASSGSYSKTKDAYDKAADNTKLLSESQMGAVKAYSDAKKSTEDARKGYIHSVRQLRKVMQSLIQKTKTFGMESMQDPKKT